MKNFPMPSPSEVIKIYKLSARKNLSQNFLFDTKLCDKFVALADPFVTDSFVCEVGPGPGCLTRSILMKKPDRLVVVEKDERFLPALKTMRARASPGCMRIVWGDVLKYKMETAFAGVAQPRPWDVKPHSSLIGNLPFNISTPLIVATLRNVANRTGIFEYGRTHMVLAFQKEVGERLMAPVAHEKRSRLSILAQVYTSISDSFIIRGSAFVPPPKVDAAVLRFVPLEKPRLDVPFEDLYMIVRVLFSFRRKMIKRAVRQMFRDDKQVTNLFFSRANVPDSLRPQEITLEEWGRLCKAYISLKQHATGIVNFEKEPFDAEFDGGEFGFHKEVKDPDRLWNGELEEDEDYPQRHSSFDSTDSIMRPL